MIDKYQKMSFQKAPNSTVLLPARFGIFQIRLPFYLNYSRLLPAEYVSLTTVCTISV